MKRTITTMLLAAAIIAVSAKTDGSVTVSLGTTDCKVTFLSERIIRVTKSLSGTTPSYESLVVTMSEPTGGVATRSSETSTSLVLRSSVLAVTIDKQSGLLSMSAGGETLLKEKDFSFTEKTSGADKGAFEVRQSFTLDDDEAIYGLGILQDGKMNRRGTHRYMIQNNTEDYQNVVHSIKGWSLYWDNYSPTSFDDDSEGMSFRSEVADAIDYYFIYGKTADGCVALLRQLTGEVPMFPLWTFGFWQSKERYRSFAEVEDVVSTYRKRGIPIDGIVQDWQYWGSHYLWNAMEFLGDGFQDAQSHIDKIHSLNAHLMITIWSSFGPHTKGYRQLNNTGHLLDFQTWPQSGIDTEWPPRMDYPSGVRCYDPFSTEAREIYWENLSRLYNKGIDGWWMDSTEPDNMDFGDSDFDRIVGDNGYTMRRMRNAYPLATVSGVYNHQRGTGSDKRVFIMTRSGFAGQQRYGSNVWSGDIGSSWESLRAQVPAGLNFTMTGNPNFNSDIGGYFAGSYNNSYNDGTGVMNPLYRELYARWMQYGVFCPVFRSHGTDVPREIYLYGDEGDPIYDSMVATIKLRYRLMPYIYSMAWQVTDKAYSYMRPLFADFKSDRKTWNMGDEFMFGSSILAAPIVCAQYTPEKTVSVDAMSGWDKSSGENAAVDILNVDFRQKKETVKYLPAGTDWYDFWSGERHQGGAEICLQTTIASIPMFIRAGSILPLCEDMQYTSEKSWDNIELRIYPGTDAEFILYEDEGDNYNYENGAYTEIPILWKDKSHTLTIGNRTGEFNGMIQARKFTIVLPDGTTKSVNYNGKKTTIKM